MESIQVSDAYIEQRDDDTDHIDTTRETSPERNECSPSSLFGERQLSGDIAKLSENLMEREVQRNMIGDRVRRLRESLLTSRRMNQHALDEELRDDVATTTVAPPSKTTQTITTTTTTIKSPSLLATEINSMDPPSSPRQENQEEKASTLSTIPSVDPSALTSKLIDQEEEIKRLRTELDQLRREHPSTTNTDSKNKNHDSSSKKILELEKQLKSNSDYIDVLELRLTAKDRAIRRLQEDVATLNRQKLELEVKLEIHDWKFYSHELYKKEIEKQSLRHHRHDDEDDDDSNASSDQENQNETEHSFADFLRELDNLEKRYIAARQENVEQMATLQHERDECLEKLQALETPSLQLRNSLSIVDDAVVTSSLRGERMKLLQTENAEYSRLVASLKWQVESLTRSCEKKEQRFQQERSILTRKNHCLETKVSVLQTDLQALSGTLDSVEKRRKYRMLESSLDDYTAELSRMEERLRTKERIISSLRAKTVDSRLASIQTVDQQQESSLGFDRE